MQRAIGDSRNSAGRRFHETAFAAQLHRRTTRPTIYFYRVPHETFDPIADGSGGETAWDYDLQRLETGLGYYLNRDLRLKATLQLNFRQGPKGAKTAHLLGSQLASNF